MKFAIGSDHRGFSAKEQVKRFLVGLGHEVLDCGTHNNSPTDYPDYAVPVCLAIQDGKAERGVLLCGSGIGMCMTANKMRGIRAALCHDELTAEMSRRHNDANVLCMAGDLLGDELIRRIVEVWVQTKFEGGRHERRVKKIMKTEMMEEIAPAVEPKEKSAKSPKGSKKN